MSKEAQKRVETPLMRQYYDIKATHPDAVLLFRVGDFYETFGSDAVKASSILGITLTRRANGSASEVELAGFPYHALQTYMPKLVRAGERVAICEQLEDPKTVTKGIVKRGVVELVTPGVALSDNILQHTENHFLAAVYFGREKTGIAFLDISTGEFYAAEGADDYIDKLLSNFAPKEVLYQRGCDTRFRTAFGDKYYTYKLDEWVFAADQSRTKLCRQFGTTTLKGFGIDAMDAAVAAAGAALYYLDFTEHRELGHITSIARIDADKYVWIDRYTMRNLELFGSNSNDLRARTGFADVMDRTRTPMGSRLLKKWIALPLRSVEEIARRHDAVEAFVSAAELHEELSEQLARIADLERIASRIAARRVLPRELVSLRASLDTVFEVGRLLSDSGNEHLLALASAIDPLEEVRAHIGRTLFPDPSNQLAKGGYIADGVSLELDDLRRVALHGKDVIAAIRERESEATGIPSLKIGFNNVFGYYIEVRNTHRDKVPAEWVRKQTLTGAERYITPELKEYEEKVLGAEERLSALEQQLYDGLLDMLQGSLAAILRNAAAVATVDCLRSFAALAVERGYVRPVVDETRAIDIRAGRHPVIETLLPVGEPYVPNDVFLDDEKQQIILVTGPNMSGKSALLRQTALIVLMAQMGSFVPAHSARIGLVDKIFTRVGASDNISQGESTFMVEMLESASILNNVSERSLVLLDEIGRGTSTYDGISIAWSIVEYLHEHRSRAKTLFATHYHELNELEAQYARVRNFNVSVREVGRSVVFLRKLVAGGTEHSFGIHVARMAGMPRWIVDRAGEILTQLESTRRGGGSGCDSTAAAGDCGQGDSGSGSGRKADVKAEIARSARKSSNATSGSQGSAGLQLSIFQLDDPVLKEIRDQLKSLDVNSLTPLEALNKLNEIKKITGL